jgi:hypothetical protein
MLIYPLYFLNTKVWVPCVPFEKIYNSLILGVNRKKNWVKWGGDSFDWVEGNVGWRGFILAVSSYKLV